MKFRKLLIVVTFSLSILGFNGSVSRAMERNVHEALKCNKNETSKVDKTKNNSKNLEKLEKYRKKVSDIREKMRVNYEKFGPIEAASVNTKFREDLFSLEEKINKAEQTLQKPDEFCIETGESSKFGLFNGNYDNMLNRKYAHKGKDLEDGETSRNKRVKYDVDEVEKSYKSSKEFGELKKNYDEGINSLTNLEKQINNDNFFDKEFRDIFGELRIKFPLVFNYCSEKLKDFEKEDSKSFDKIKNIINFSHGEIKDLIKKDFLGYDEKSINGENINHEGSAYRILNDLEKKLTENKIKAYTSEIEKLRADFKEILALFCANIYRFVLDLNKLKTWNKETDAELFSDGSEGFIDSDVVLERLKNNFNKFKEEICNDEINAENLANAVFSLFETINFLSNRIENYYVKTDKNRWIPTELKKMFRNIRSFISLKLKCFAEGLKHKIEESLGDVSSFNLCNNKEEVVFSNKDEIISGLNSYLVKNEQALDDDNFENGKAEFRNLIETIDSGIKDLYSYYIVAESVSMVSRSLKQKTYEFIDLLNNYFDRKLQCGLIESLVDSKFGKEAVEVLKK